MLRRLVSVSAALLFGLSLSAAVQPVLTPQQSGTTNRLQAISPVNSRVVWASGVAGTWVKTVDGGRNWQAGVVPGAETLEFRDVQGMSQDAAYLLSAGPGTSSRIYKTKNGGKSWSLEFENQNPNAFYDCFAFWTADRGLATSDSVNGLFPAILTMDGANWRMIGNQMPAAQPGEGSFSASGTCVATFGKKYAWIATGSAAKPRILTTINSGKSWQAYNTPINGGNASSGIFTVAFRDPQHGILGGGNLNAPAALADTVASSQDGGKTWHVTSRPPFTGAVYGASYVLSQGRSHHGKRRVVITGPAGAVWSPNEGETWFTLPGVKNYWAVAFSRSGSGWLVGTEGRILNISFGEPGHWDQ